MVSGLDLTGRINLNAAPAIATARKLAGEFTALSAEGKVGSAEMVKLAQTFKTVGAAANAERASIAKLATAQATLNKTQAESNALTQKANALKRTSTATAYSTRTTGKAKAGAITSDAANRTAIAEGKVALDQQRALTEEIRRTTLAEDAQGRAALRAAQTASVANRDRIAQARLVLAQQNAVTAAARRSVLSEEQAASAFGHIGGAAEHVAVVAGGAFIGLIANAVSMDREFANVVRTSTLVDQKFSSIGQKAAAIGTLRGQFDALAETLPISYKELTEIGSAANQLGIQSPQLANFTQAVAQFSATTGVSVDTASTAFGRLDSLIIDVTRNGKQVGGVNHDFVGLADAINKVGVRSVATDQQIINIASQIAGIANVAGLGYKEIIGFSGALASVGVQPFLARGLTTRLFSNIIEAVDDGGKALDAFGKVSGETGAQFAKSWASNPGDALIKLMHGVATSGTGAIKALKSIGVTSVLDIPALLRLARGADSNGVAFGLLAQTMRDASDAAGENAKQYGVIATTVQARLQVALNRAQIALRDIAESDMGPLTDFINGLSQGILTFTQNLDKPVKLLGIFDLGIKNSQLFGAATLGVGIVAGLALITAAGSKLAATFLRVRGAVGFVRDKLASAGAGLGLYTREATAADGATVRLSAAQTRLAAAATAAAEAQAASAGAAAVAARSATRATPLAFPTAPAAAQAVSASRVFSVDSSGVATMKSAEAEASRLSRVMSSLGGIGAAAGSRVVGAAKGIAGAARSAGGAVSNLVGGPLGLLAIGGTAVIAGFQAAAAAAAALGTSAAGASVSILKAGSAMDELNSVQISTQDPIGALFDKSTISAGKLTTSTKQLGRSLEALGSGGVVSDFAAKFQNIFQNPKVTSGFNTTTAYLAKLDDGFENLANSGNLDGAVKGIQTLFHGQSTTAVTNGLAQMSNATSILTEKLKAEGKAITPKNLANAARSNDLFTDSEKRVLDATDATTKAFGENTTEAAEYTSAVGKLGAAATDLNTAFSDTKLPNLDSSKNFGTFIKTANTNYKDFAQSQLNAVKIANDTGADLTRLSALDPHILSGAIKSGKEGEKQLAKVMELQDAEATFQASMAQLGNDPALYQRFATLGAKAKAAFFKSLQGGASLEEAFTATLKLDTQDAIVKAEKTGKEIDAIKATIAISGDPATAYKKGESAKTYVDGLKAEFPIFGDNLPAIHKGETAKQYIDRLTGKMTADANNGPGKRKADGLKSYIDGKTGNVKADASTSYAEGQLNYLARDRTVHLHVAGGGGGTFATGGIVRGPGTGTSDSIPARLSDGEYVIRAAQVKKNLALLDQINYGSRGYASGGYVTNSANYEGTYASRQSVQASRGPAISVTELSAYDRHLLVSIQEAVGVTIGTDTVSRATTTGNTRQVRRGNG